MNKIQSSIPASLLGEVSPVEDTTLVSGRSGDISYPSSPGDLDIAPGFPAEVLEAEPFSSLGGSDPHTDSGFGTTFDESACSQLLADRMHLAMEAAKLAESIAPNDVLGEKRARIAPEQFAARIQAAELAAAKARAAESQGTLVSQPLPQETTTQTTHRADHPKWTPDQLAARIEAAELAAANARAAESQGTLVSQPLRQETTTQTTHRADHPKWTPDQLAARIEAAELAAAKARAAEHEGTLVAQPPPQETTTQTTHRPDHPKWTPEQLAARIQAAELAAAKARAAEPQGTLVKDSEFRK